MIDSLEDLRERLAIRLANMQEQTRGFYGLWDVSRTLKNVEPIASALLNLSIKALDLQEALNIVLLSLEEMDSKENEFISQSSCRILVLRAFEQRETLFREKKKLQAWANETRIELDIESLDAVCKKNKTDLLYIGRLSKVRNEVGHYSDDHLKVINYIQQIDVAAVINSSKGLFDCYAVLLDLYNELLVKRLAQVNLQNLREASP